MNPFAAAALFAWWAGTAGPDYARGLTLAREARWVEARAAFEAGAKKAPHDPRFPSGLAGLAYRQGNRGEAKAHLRHALTLAPVDSYANEFLGTIYLLEGNTEAALEVWNRIGRPRIEEVRYDPPPKLNPVLADRTLVFAPATILRVEEYRASLRRIESLGLFPNPRIVLQSRDDDGFDAVVRAPERRAHWLSAVRGLPFATVYAEWPDIRGNGQSLNSLIRWDSNKRRLSAGFASPLAHDPAWRLRIAFDARDENWSVPGMAAFNLRKAEGSLDLTRVTGTGWTLSSGMAVSSRTVAVSRDGLLLKARASAGRDLLRLPGRNLVVTGNVGLELGRLTEGGAGAFTKAQAELAGGWRRLTARLRGGKLTGTAPFDEQFFLGVERDTSLWLRGHPATEGGRKGNGPIGRSYGLMNLEWDQPLWRPGFVTLSAGPLLDGARVRGQWIADPGVQVTIRLAAGPGVTVSWSRGTIYAVVSPLNW
ncbi:MAG TPA: tetratricopeptide repeat protein [Bryobacteraceae bacterium]|nr:tetratricopeptide repeat protein [Bryobacteraceae bacterium]